MPRRQILSSQEKERLLVVPDDDVLLSRMCYLSEHDLALINKYRRPANRLGFAVLLCYLRGPGFHLGKYIAHHDGVVSRLAAHLKFQPDLWTEYASREVTRWEHLAERMYSIMHIKFMVADGSAVKTGSFNDTSSAEKKKCGERAGHSGCTRYCPSVSGRI
jgi:hypothetical protein